MKTEFVVDHFSSGIICPGGQKVGDQKSGDQMGSGPNGFQPRYTKIVRFQNLEKKFVNIYHEQLIELENQNSTINTFTWLQFKYSSE